MARNESLLRYMAATLLAEGKPYPVVAEEIGRTTRTIERWMSEESFREMVDEIRDDCLLRLMTEKIPQLVADKQVRIAKLHSQYMDIEKQLDNRLLKQSDRIAYLRMKMDLLKQISMELGQFGVPVPGADEDRVAKRPVLVLSA